MTPAPLRTLYPPLEPYRTGRLRVSALHELYFEESGNPSGKPVIFVHGGPGGGTEPKHRRFFDPEAYRIVLLDQRGCSALFPDAWESYLAPIPEAERGDLLHAYHRRLTGPDPKVRQEAARAWSVWEGSTSCLYPNPDLIARTGGDDFSLAFARIECHYFVNRGFMRTDAQLLEDVPKIRHIPGVIVQGRYDVVCPPESAWALHRAWPEAELKMIADAGHSANEPGITAALVEATDRFRGR